MPQINKLNDRMIKNAKPREKVYELHDGRNLSLEVTPEGGKRWRLRYRRPATGKANRLTLGVYPAVSLSEARVRRDQALSDIAQGTDPSDKRKEVHRHVKGEDTFEHVARKWIDEHMNDENGWSDGHLETVVSRLEKNVFPFIGDRYPGDITPPEFLEVINRIKGRGATSVAQRVRQMCQQVFAKAIGEGLAVHNPAESINYRGLFPSKSGRHFPAIIQPKEIGQLLRDIDKLEGSFVVKSALRLAPYVFVRPGEIRSAEWVDIDLGNAMWIIPAAKTKLRRDHMVPLSRQSLAILNPLFQYTGGGRFVFPSIRTSGRPMSENTLNVAIRRLGYTKDDLVAHGFRAMATTVLNEMGFDTRYVERQMAHVVKNKVEAVYNRAMYIDSRMEMMQVYADYLDQLRSVVE